MHFKYRNNITHTWNHEFYFTLLSVWAGGPVVWQHHAGLTSRDQRWLNTRQSTMNRDRYALTHTEKHTDRRRLVSDFLPFCLFYRSTHLRERTFASLNYLILRLKLSLRLTESLWTGCWASVVSRWELLSAWWQTRCCHWFLNHCSKLKGQFTSKSQIHIIHQSR